MTWGVFHLLGGDVHVVPVDEDEHLAGDHELSRSCPCHPMPVRESPLEDPIWSHNDPDWPGAIPGIVH